MMSSSSLPSYSSETSGSSSRQESTPSNTPGTGSIRDTTPPRQPVFRQRKSSNVIPQAGPSSFSCSSSSPLKSCSAPVTDMAAGDRHGYGHGYGNGALSVDSTASGTSSTPLSPWSTAVEMTMAVGSVGTISDSTGLSSSVAPMTSPSKLYTPSFRSADEHDEGTEDFFGSSSIPAQTQYREGRTQITKTTTYDHGSIKPSLTAIPPHMLQSSHSHSQSHPNSLRRNAELERRGSSSSSTSASAAEEGEAMPLLGDTPDSDSMEEDGDGGWYTGPLFVTGVKLLVLFVLFTGVVVGTFWYGIPKLDPGDKDMLKLPRSFTDLQALNTLFQKYKTRYPYRILTCGVVSYLFVQTFTLPGSMYLSILFGAAYGMWYGLLISCLCDSCGSLLCYTLSALLAPPLLKLPFYRARVETWRIKIMGDPALGRQVSWDGVAAFLIVLRIAPFPPHWIANFVAPHLGIPMGLFWLTCFIGIAPVSVIHVTIGSSLDSMTSAADFHLLSLRNILGLGAVVVAVLIPVGLKRIFKNDLGELGEAEQAIEAAGQVAEGPEEAVNVPVVHPFYGGGLADGGEERDDGRGTGSGSRRYQAVDSGVVLAGPSVGDPAYDTEEELDSNADIEDQQTKGEMAPLAEVKGNSKRNDKAAASRLLKTPKKGSKVHHGPPTSNDSVLGNKRYDAWQGVMRGYGAVDTGSVSPTVQ